MKRREAVNKKKKNGRARGAKPGRRKTFTLMASVEESRRPHVPIPDRGYYRPLKKAVTMRLDADVIAWFKKGGRRYQTRINGALREVMEQGMKKAGD